MHSGKILTVYGRNSKGVPTYSLRIVGPSSIDDGPVLPIVGWNPLGNTTILNSCYYLFIDANIDDR